jgi:hypothetical protein
MTDNRVIVLQGSDIKKLQEELNVLVKTSETKPSSITQSQSAVPVIGSRSFKKYLIKAAQCFHI